MKVIKRDGRVVDYNKEKIVVAIQKANQEVMQTKRATNEEIKEIVKYIEDLNKKRMLVEDIQDIIEEKLMEIHKYELAKKYIVYNGQYDVVFPAGSKDAETDDRITKLWSETLPALLLAGSDEEFDKILESFRQKRDEMGFADLMEKKTAHIQESKKKLGIE